MSSKAWVMDWEQLEYFRVAGRLEHVTAAAERLAITQPTLSRSLARLERELGVPLFVHVGRRVRLTRYGTAFLARVERALHEIDEARRQLADLASTSRGHVALGFLRTLGSDYVPEIVRRFRDRNPDVVFAFTQNNGVELQGQLLAGELDACFMAGPVDDERVVWRRVFDQELVLVVPRGHRLAKRRTVRLAEVRAEPFVSFKEGHSIRTLSDALCAQAGFSPSVAFAGDASNVLRGFVNAGFGVAIVPSENVRDGLVALRITQPPARRRIGLAWVRDRYRSGAERAFERFVLPAGG
jgi:DNA-binding transcriptional LysR family regulator